MGKYYDIKTSKAAWQKIARLRKKRRIPELEGLLLQDANAAYNYAKSILQARWPEAEPIILREGSSKVLFFYAKHVIRDRWAEAEDKIIKCSKYIMEYTKDLVKNRWKEAEDKIIGDFWNLENKNPFIEQKDYFWDFEIMKYAKEMVGDRWCEAEKIFSKNPIALKQYAEEVLEDKLPEDMHNLMIAYSLQYQEPRDRKNIAIKEYFEFVNNAENKFKKQIKNRMTKPNMTLEELLQTF